jgi:hypothetical protein
MKDQNFVRFRCAGYPECNTYLKLPVEAVANKRFRESTRYQMISPECEIVDFIKKVKDKDVLEIIHLANQEATEAERNSLRKMRKRDSAGFCGKEYADSLKKFINFMRYECKPPFI